MQVEQKPGQAVVFIPPNLFHIAEQALQSARAAIVRRAGNELSATRMDYIDNLVIERSGDSVALVLKGRLPNYIESGLAPFDMRLTHLRRNYKTSKDGVKYKSIPFRHTTPGARGPSMGSQYKAPGPMSRQQPKLIFSNKEADRIGKQVHKVFKDGTLNDVEFPRMRPWHRSDPFQGMRAIEQGGQNRMYTTFRTVSEAGDPRAWQHPGITARRYFVEGARVADTVLPRLM